MKAAIIIGIIWAVMTFILLWFNCILLRFDFRFHERPTTKDGERFSSEILAGMKEERIGVPSQAQVHRVHK